MDLFDYDDRSIESIYEYAKKLENKTFREIVEEYEKNDEKAYINKYEFSEPSKVHVDTISLGTSFNYDAKGQLGNLIEALYFGYKPNSEQDADFPKVGIELKMTPIDKKKDGGYRAGERLSITNISYEDPVEEDFYSSHLWKKVQLILLIEYLRDRDKDRMDYEVKYVNLFSPDWFEEDMVIILEDYAYIINKIKEGKAHELSESDTKYLGACTKGSTAESSTRPQYYGEHIPARKRNFCFKSSYMNYILQTRILQNKLPYDKILKKGLKQGESFEEHILKMINNNIRKTDRELCKEYNREYNNNKAQWNDLAFRMLGVSSNNAEEFEKANIVLKTIRIEENGKNKESMSFPPFKFKELVNEEWEESTVYNYFETTRFMFVVFKKVGDCYILGGAKMWNMPYYDLNEVVKEEWTKIKNTIRDGVNFKVINKGSKFIVNNNLPGIKDSKILHIRPHARKAAYKLNNGFTIGNINKDANELPDGQWMTTQSFWLNSKYILKQIKGEFLDEY